MFFHTNLPFVLYLLPPETYFLGFLNKAVISRIYLIDLFDMELVNYTSLGHNFLFCLILHQLPSIMQANCKP